MKFLTLLGLCTALFVSSAHADSAPMIVSLTTSQRVLQGSSVALTVSVNGTAPFAYQWKKDGSAISGATNSTYAIASVAVTDAGSYTVIVSNGAGSVTSDVTLLDVTAATAPRFYSQPSAATYTVGNTLNFYASVDGSSPLTFVWKKDGVVIAGATSSSYNKADAQLADAGSYTVTVSNVAGSVTSNAFAITITAQVPPVFSSSPSSATVNPGDSLYFYSSVNNSSGVTYQWFKDRVAIAGANYSSYSRYNVTAADTGSYTVVATNGAGSTTSAAAVVTLRPAAAPSSVTISSGPLTVTLGESLNLYSSYSGTAPFTFQWQKDGIDLSGATSSSYYKTNVTADDAGSYRLVVTNSIGSASSSSTVVSVSAVQGPIITSHPVSVTIYPGSSPSLSVNASGTGSLTFAWSKDGVVIPNATSSYFYLPTQNDPGSSVYTVKVSNAQGSVTSQPATVTVLPASAPVIDRQPTAAGSSPGQSFSLAVSAHGYPSPTYQWKKDGVVIPGATSSSYSKYSAASSDSGVYSVVVSNSADTVTSEGAVVTISAAAAPVILAQPASASLLLGDYFSGLSIDVSSQAGATVQWYRDGVAIANATNYSYYLSSAQPAMAGTYHAVVTNATGSATSDDAVITVDLSTARPVIVYTGGGRAVPGGSAADASIILAPGIASYTVAWKKDGVTIPNATALYFSLSNFAVSSEGTYTAEVTTSGGTYTSRPIKYSLRNKGQVPFILSSPTAVRATVNSSVSFYVSADGETPLTYQWKKDGVDIPGTTSYNYYLSSATAATAGQYTVVVTNRNGSATSSAATLTVVTAADIGPPIFGYNPASQTVTAGVSSLYLSASLLSSVGNETFQWYKDGVALTNAIYSSYSTSPTSAATAGRYKVVATNSAGSTTSTEAVITVTQRETGPVFATQPSAQTAYSSGAVTFSVQVTSASAVTYQWRKDGVNLAGATSATLSLTGLKTSDAGSYTVLATNSVGSTASTPAMLTVVASSAPTITSQPNSQISGRTGSVSFAVSATGTPAPGYQWKKNGADLPGANSATLSLTNLVTSQAGTYSVVVTNLAGSVTSSNATLTVYDELPAAPAFTTQPASRAAAPREDVTLTVVVTGFPTPAVQWFKNGVALSGETGTTLSLGKMTLALAGEYQAVATNEIGTTKSDTARLSYTASPFAGTYFGTLSTGESWAMEVRDDGTATFLGLLSAAGKIIFLKEVFVAPDGTFSVGSSTVAGADRSARAIGHRPATGTAADSTFADRYFTGGLSGKIANGALTGQIGGSTQTLAGELVGAATGAAGLAGEYSAVPLGSSLGEIHALAAPDGSLLLVEVSVSGVRGGRGTVAADGSFTVNRPEFAYTGSLSGSTGSISGSYMPAGGRPVAIGSDPSTGNGLDRLVNVSTRGVAGKDSATLIAGFVITGQAPKDVLIRAVGPTLKDLQVNGALANPRLRLYKGGTAILENDDWMLGGAATEIAAAASRLGAYPLVSGSADAALLARLEPGIYSAHVTSDDGSTGVVLMEVYDASVAALGGPKVVNLSSRGNVGVGEDVLIVGFVISGDVPKKVLVRGVGPTLTAAGVSGALLDPKLQLYHEGKVVAENDDWSAGADAALVSAAASTVGAGTLPNGSKDAALLLYLAPGVYSAHVSGAGNSTGIALIEVYEVP